MFFMARSRPLWLLISRIPFLRSGAARPSSSLPRGVSDDDDSRVHYSPDDDLSSDEAAACYLSGGRHSRRSEDDNDCHTSWGKVQPPGWPTSHIHAVYAPTNASVTFNFKGPAIKIYGGSLISPNFQNGQGAITLNDKPLGTFTFPLGLAASLVFSSDPLGPNEDHVLEIHFEGSPDAIVYIDSWDASLPPGPGPVPVIPPTLNPSNPLPPATSGLPTPTSQTTPPNGNISTHPTTGSASREPTRGTDSETTTLSNISQTTSGGDHGQFTSSQPQSKATPSADTPVPSAGTTESASSHRIALSTAGVALGIVVALLALGLVLYLCWKSWQRRTRARMNLPPVEVKAAPSMIFSETESDADPVSAVPASQRTSQVIMPYVFARPPSRTSKRTSLPYAFTRRLSSVASSHDPPVPRIPGISPYTYERVVPYPESMTDDSVSHMERDFDTFVPPVPDLPPGAKFISTATAPASVPPAQPVMIDLEGGSSNTILPTGSAADPALVRQITFTTKGRVLRVQNPDYRSNASTAGDHETVSLS